MSTLNIIPVILSGGTGSRLWPMSRASHPKPFLQFNDNDSLLKKTAIRAKSLNNVQEIITITNRDYYLKTQAEYAQLQNINDLETPLSFLLEPIARNTAPAIALATLMAQEKYGPNAILLVLPADHLINDALLFIDYCEKAVLTAQQDYIVTFGITPKHPETGFGYIQSDKLIPGFTDCYQVQRFVEKPSTELAISYLQSQDYLWNAGMFCFSAKTLLQELSVHAPDLLSGAQQCFALSQTSSDRSQIMLDSDSFSRLPNISIDYALMEKSQSIAVLACNLDWQDIGSWEAIKKLHNEDNNRNAIQGEALLIDSANNFVHSDTRLVAAIGINNLTIIDTPDAILITPHHRTQEVRKIADTLKQQNHPTYHTHRTVIRPWGSYTVLEDAPSFKIKRIEVKAGASLSLQMHHFRSEHWVVVQGVAEVMNGEERYILQSNESTFIPIKTRHRLSNPGTENLIIIEVQTGTYLGEDDIVRFEDIYGREHQNSHCL